jgi:hypothetical protein
LEESELWTGKSERSERDDGIWEIYREYVSEDTFFSGTLSTNPKFWGRNGPHGDQSSEWWKWPSSYELVYCIPKKIVDTLGIAWLWLIYPITECDISIFSSSKLTYQSYQIIDSFRGIFC